VGMASVRELVGSIPPARLPTVHGGGLRGLRDDGNRGLPHHPSYPTAAIE
jgi:hypothetical protein